MPLQSSPTDGGGKAQTQRRAFKTGGLFRGRLSKPAESPSRLGHVVARCAHEIDDRIVLHLQLVAADGALVEGFQVLGALEHRAQIAALLVEAIAKTGRRLSALWDEITQKYGAAEMAEHDFHFSSAERTRIFKLLMEDKQLPEFPCEIAKVSYMDGCKVYFKNGGWVIARFSGTEPLLRVFCEMDTMENAEKIAKILTEFLSL